MRFVRCRLRRMVCIRLNLGRLMLTRRTNRMTFPPLLAIFSLSIGFAIGYLERLMFMWIFRLWRGVGIPARTRTEYNYLGTFRWGLRFNSFTERRLLRLRR